MTENSREDDASEEDVVGFLYVMEGNQKGDIIKLYAGRNTIGTSSECAIILDDPNLTTKHASVRYEDGTYIVRDLDSRDGTFVNGEEIVKMELTENEEILVGNTKMKFKRL